MTLSPERLLDDLRAALDHRGPAIVGEPPDRPAPDGTALVVRTSGSTGPRGRPVALSVEAITASARSTQERLGGPGRWLLALPAGHIAGLQVLCRSILAGTGPTLTRPGESLAEAVARMPTDGPRYASIVPTQLTRSTTPAGRADLLALTRLDAVLVGGAAVDALALATAREAGVNAVTTYGMTETAGGCVYDSRPLTGVRAHVEEGRIWLAGPMLTSGYLDGGPQPFTHRDGYRWFPTSDLGRFSSGRLDVLGRADDVLITGGVNVHPAIVEHVLSTARALGIREVAVVGRPCPQWGEEVAAIVVPADPGPWPTRSPVGLLELIRAEVKGALGAVAAPRVLFLRSELPRRGPGKIDRRALTAWAATTSPDAHHT